MQGKARRELAGRLAGLFINKTGHRKEERELVLGRRAEQFLASLHRDLESWHRQSR
jgi:hypothetical protein